MNRDRADRADIKRKCFAVGLAFCMLGITSIFIQNAKTETPEIDPGKGSITHFSDNATSKILNFPEAGDIIIYVNIPKNTTVTNTTMNITGIPYTENGNRTDTSSTEFTSGILDKLIIENNSIKTPPANLKGLLWCPFGDFSIFYGSDGFLTDYSNEYFLGIPTIEPMNFTCADWRGNDGIDQERPLVIDTNASIVASGEKVNGTYYGARVYTLYRNNTLSPSINFTFPTTDYGQIEFICLNSSGINGMLGGAYYPNSSTAHSLLYWKNNNSISLKRDLYDNLTMRDGSWLKNDSVLYIVGNNFTGKLFVYKYYPTNDTIIEAINGSIVGYPRIGIRPQEDYALIPGTIKGQNPPSSESTIYKYNLLTNQISSINMSNNNWTDIAWNTNGSNALICGEQGTLYLYDNETGEFSTVNTNTTNNLTSIGWKTGESYALIAGENGIILQFINNTISALPKQYMTNGSFVSSATYGDSIKSVIPCWDINDKDRGIDISLSNDNGSTWFTGEYDTELEFPSTGSYLKYMLNISTLNTSHSPLFNAIELDFITVGDYPTNPSLDVANDSSLEWNYSGTFEDTEMVGNFSSDINQFVGNHEPDQNGLVAVPFNFHSNSQGAIKVSDLMINYSTPEFIVTDISFSEMNRQIGQTVTITARIWNNGDINANSVTIRFLCDNNTIDEGITDIQKGSYSDVNIDWIPQTDGFHLIAVIADPTNSFNSINSVKCNYIEYYFVPTLIISSFDILPQQTIEFTNISIFADQFSIHDGGTFIGENVSMFIGITTDLDNNANLIISNSSGFFGNTIVCGDSAKIDIYGLDYVGGHSISSGNSTISFNNIAQMNISDQISIDDGGSIDIFDVVSLSTGTIFADMDSSVEINGSNYIWINSIESHSFSSVSVGYSNYTYTNNISSVDHSLIDLNTGNQMVSGNITANNFGLINISVPQLFSHGFSMTTDGTITMHNTSLYITGNISGNHQEFNIIDSNIFMDLNTPGNLSIDIYNEGELSIVNSTISSGSNCNYSVKLRGGTNALITQSTFENPVSVNVSTGDIQLRDVNINNAKSSAIMFYGVSAVMENTSIKDSNDKDIIVESGAYLTCWNSEFNISRVVVSDTSNLTKKWDLQVQVLNDSEVPVPDANVKVYDNNSNLVFNSSTNSTGWISERMLCTEYYASSSSTQSLNPYKIEASTTSPHGYSSIMTSLDQFRRIPVQLVYLHEATIMSLTDNYVYLGSPTIKATSSPPPVKYVRAKSTTQILQIMHYAYDEGALVLGDWYNEQWSFTFTIKDGAATVAGGTPVTKGDVQGQRDTGDSTIFTSFYYTAPAYELKKPLSKTYSIEVDCHWTADPRLFPLIPSWGYPGHASSQMIIIVPAGLNSLKIGDEVARPKDTHVNVFGHTSTATSSPVSVNTNSNFEFQVPYHWHDDWAFFYSWFHFELSLVQVYDSDGAICSGPGTTKDIYDYPIKNNNGGGTLKWTVTTRLAPGDWTYIFHLRAKYSTKPMWGSNSETSTGWQYPGSSQASGYKTIWDTDKSGYNNDSYTTLYTVKPG